MLTLKTYQERALEHLAGFFSRCRTDGIQSAWDSAMAAQNRRGAYHAAAFGEIPCVCLRVPTGGGKTLLAAHAIAQTGKLWRDTDAPIAVWLTPSDTIRTQTLDALKHPRHPYRQALEAHFPGRVRVCDLESLVTVGPHEVGKTAVIIVATIQSFRVEKTSQRNVYAFDEALEPHFQGLSPYRAAGLETVSEADLENQRYLTRADLGRVKASIANWLHLHRPLVIVDEAHNNRTHKSFETLKRLNPACIIELSATPMHGSNVLYHVAAQELKAEDMIKLPIVLREHPTGWEDAVRDAILTRKHLETLADREAEYLRPILLFQAQPKGEAVTVDVLREHLTEQERIPQEQIAIATGTQKDLDGVNLFDRASPVRFVITVEALKEGWDCSFAYVLCSLQESRSAKDVEQLLGRVLRMPYARSRQHPELNRAYAHIVATSFAEAAERLTDRMVNNMGFDPYEAAQAVQPPIGPDLFGDTEPPGQTPRKPLLPDFVATLPGPTPLPVPAELAGQVEIRSTSQGATVIVRGEMTEAVEDFLLSTVEPKHQPAVQEKIERHKAQCAAILAPASRGETFAPIPMLCLWPGRGVATGRKGNPVGPRGVEPVGMSGTVARLRGARNRPDFRNRFGREKDHLHRGRLGATPLERNPHGSHGTRPGALAGPGNSAAGRFTGRIVEVSWTGAAAPFERSRLFPDRPGPGQVPTRRSDPAGNRPFAANRHCGRLSEGPAGNGSGAAGRFLPVCLRIPPQSLPRPTAVLQRPVPVQQAFFSSNSRSSGTAGGWGLYRRIPLCPSH